MERGAAADDRPGPWRGRPPGDVALLLVGAAALAFALEPPANLLARRGWRRGLAAGAVGLSTTLESTGSYVHSRALPALPAAASIQALLSIYLHRYEVIASPLTATPHPARRVP